MKVWTELVISWRRISISLILSCLPCCITLSASKWNTLKVEKGSLCELTRYRHISGNWLFNFLSVHCCNICCPSFWKCHAVFRDVFYEIIEDKIVSYFAVATLSALQTMFLISISVLLKSLICIYFIKITAIHTLNQF